MSYPFHDDPEVLRVMRETGMGELQAIRHVQQRRMLAEGLPRLAPQFSDAAIYKIAQRLAEAEDLEIRGRETPADSEFQKGIWRECLQREEARQAELRRLHASIEEQQAEFDPSYEESDDADTWNAGRRKENRLQALLMRFRRLLGGAK